jgi:glutamyl-tRNA reductase
MERALRRLAKGEEPKAVLDQLSHALAAKLLHAPTHALSHAQDEDREQLAQLLARLYQIPRPE